MNARKYSSDAYNSSDNDDTNTDDYHNRAMLMSYNDNIPEFGNNITRKGSIMAMQSVEYKNSAVKSTSILVSLRDKRARKLGEKNDQDCRANEQNRKETSLGTLTTGFKVKNCKPRIVSDEILLNKFHPRSEKNVNDNLSTNVNVNVERTLTSSSNDIFKKSELYSPDRRSNEDSAIQLSSNLEKSINAWKYREEFADIGNLDESNIWPALTALETTLNTSDANTSKDHHELIEKLNERFNYSPRSFTETLVTIIEESFVTPEETSHEFLEILKNSNDKRIKLLEDESTPNLIYSPLSDDFHESENSTDDTTKYKSLKRQATPMKSVRQDINKKKIYRQTANLILNRENSKMIVHRSRVASPSGAVAKNKIYCKTPGLIMNRETPKISMTHRLRIGSASSVNESPNMDNKTFLKTPKIILNPPTPLPSESHYKRRNVSINSNEDDEYLTAESEYEEMDSIEFEEPRASSSKKLDMSRIAFHHKEWLQTYEKVSKYKPLSHHNKSSVIDKKLRLSTHGNKLEKRWLQELKKKRQKCFELVDELLENAGTTDPAVEEKSPCSCTPCKLTVEFLKTLQACSEYSAYGTKAREVCKSTANNSRFVTSLSMNLKKSEDLSPHLSVNYGKKKSPRRSFGKKTMTIKSPGARYLSRHSKVGPMPLKRRSLKGAKTPVIDRSSIRPVAELRSFFSATDGSESNAKPKTRIPKTIVPCRNPEDKTPESGRYKIVKRGPHKYKNVVSPVSQYIRGKN